MKAGDPATQPELLSVIRGIYREMCHLQRNEHVLMIADSRTPADILAAFLTEARSLHADAHLLQVPVPAAPALQTSIEWSPIVTGAAAQADLIVDFAVGYAEFIVDAVRRGSRVISPGDGTGNELLADVLIRTMGRVDLDGLRREAGLLAEMFTVAREVHISSDAGTDVRIDLDGLVGEAADGYLWDPDRGDFKSRWDLLPPAQPGVTIPAGRANGTIAVDGFILWQPEDIEVPIAPVLLDVEVGEITRVRGEAEFARKLSSWLESFSPDRTVFQGPAHCNLGTNPQARLTDHQEFERLRGTITFGWGDSTIVAELAGLDPRHAWVSSPVHWDTMIRQPTLELDDRVLVDEGAIRVEG